MHDIIQIVGPEQTLEILGIRLMGVSAANGKRLLFTLVFVLVALLLGWLLRLAADRAIRGQVKERVDFWVRQSIQLFTASLIVIGLASIWFEDPTRLATTLGLVTAGFALALQKVITSIAAYFIILRGQTFKVGDRISMGNVRGDVLSLDFTQTTILEMGSPPVSPNADPRAWNASRQYTGRVVTVSNARIFDEPVFNDTRDLPYFWEELSVPIAYAVDRDQVEAILLDAAQRHAITAADLPDAVRAEIQRRFALESAELRPRVYWRLTERWLELTVRFIAKEHGSREARDAVSRQVLQALTAAGIGIG